MQWLRNNIEKINTLVSQGTPDSLTYAALECRLAIEMVCYERLKTAHPYISHRDLAKWTPGRVVTQLVAEVDPYIASTRTFSISREPVASSTQMSRHDYMKQDYVVIGTQVGFDAKALGTLWQALSSCLHVTMPKTADDNLQEYRNADILKRKVSEAVRELERLAAGTLIANVVGPCVSCECSCGSTIRRGTKGLSDGQIVHCINPECYESFTVVIRSDEYGFDRRTIPLVCENCGTEAQLAARELEERLRPGMAGSLRCAGCGETTYFAWRLMKGVRPNTH